MICRDGVHHFAWSAGTTGDPMPLTLRCQCGLAMRRDMTPIAAAEARAARAEQERDTARAERYSQQRVAGRAGAMSEHIEIGTVCITHDDVFPCRVMLHEQLAASEAARAELVAALESASELVVAGADLYLLVNAYLQNLDTSDPPTADDLSISARDYERKDRALSGVARAVLSRQPAGGVTS